MRLATQALGIPLLAAASAAASSALVGLFANVALGVCDPKFGCSFGLEFQAGASAVVGLLSGVLLLCALAGYTAATGRLIAQRTTLVVAVLLGLALGGSWAAIATVTYM